MNNRLISFPALIGKGRVHWFLFFLLLALPVTAQQWPTVTPEAKPGARWWWLGSAVDKENLQWNMQEYAKHGIGALEITPLYGVQGNDANNIPYLSDKWMEMLRFTQEQGKANGIEIDMATGTGWPFGGPLQGGVCRKGVYWQGSQRPEPVAGRKRT